MNVVHEDVGEAVVGVGLVAQGQPEQLGRAGTGQEDLLKEILF